MNKAIFVRPAHEELPIRNLEEARAKVREQRMFVEMVGPLHELPMGSRYSSELLFRPEHERVDNERLQSAYWRIVESLRSQHRSRHSFQIGASRYLLAEAD